MMPRLINIQPHISTPPIDPVSSTPPCSRSPSRSPTIVVVPEDPSPRAESPVSTSSEQASPSCALPATGSASPGDYGSAFQPPPAAGQETLQEISARLLFAIVNWIKVLPSFRSLEACDQVRQAITQI